MPDCTVAKIPIKYGSFLSQSGALYVSDPSNSVSYIRYDSAADYNNRTRNWQQVSAQVAKADFGREVGISGDLRVVELG